jgi:sugar phosphate isomerase/epimerase
MNVGKLTDFSRLVLHTITTRPLAIEEAVDIYSTEEITGVTVWRDALNGRNVYSTGDLIRNHGLKITSLCRGGFFPALQQNDREKAITENKKIIDEAAALGAPLIVLVCGASPGQAPEVSRHQIINALEKIIPHAEKNNIKLGIEPLHPMYADTRSAINTMKQANDVAEIFNSKHLGVVVDVFHVWWDTDLKKEIERCGKRNNIMAFHLCDWKLKMEDMLNDRGLMGEGCIQLRMIREWVENAGFKGDLEVEIFSNRYWAMDQKKFIGMIKEAYLNHC